MTEENLATDWFVSKVWIEQARFNALGSGVQAVANCSPFTAKRHAKGKKMRIFGFSKPVLGTN
ncbi:MAG TPA: hypothetical protein VH595_11570 [Verrucomicrobiae bacterium]|nr:hypothetical protein [Verrucomicrobiae bacterium]